MRGLSGSMLAAVVMLGWSSARAECRHVQGKFASAPADPATCTSPVGLCTVGGLTGALRADYHFTMAQLLPTGDPTVPSVMFYTGLSEIETRHGALVGTDTGAIDLNPAGPGTFATMITITDGLGSFAGASGFLQVRGHLDFSTGGASGDYQGSVCTP